MSLVNKVFGQLFDIGVDILVSTLQPNGSILVQTGDSTSESADTDAAEWWQHTGFASRPAVPSRGASSCQGIAFRSNDRDVIVASRDVRGTTIYGNLSDGETCVYASAGQARQLFKKNGSISQITTNDNTATGTTVGTYVGPDKIQLYNEHGSITIDANGITLAVAGGQAGLQIGSVVATLSGQQVQVSGMAVAVAGQTITAIGTPGALPPGPTSALSGPAASPVSAKPSTNVQIMG